MFQDFSLMYADLQPTLRMPLVDIVVSKKNIPVVLEKNSRNEVQLKSGKEFKIKFQNPNSRRLAAKIWINGKDITSNYSLIVPTGTSELGRFLDTAKNFVFNAFETEVNEETITALETNGLIKIEFFEEVVFTPKPKVYRKSNFENPRSIKNRVTGEEYNYNSLSDFESGFTQRTGRIEEGENSNQKLVESGGHFSQYPFSEVLIQMKEKSPGMKLSRVCECGNKISSSAKFCKECGRKV